MGESISYDKLKISCILPISTLSRFSFTCKPGEHSMADITGIIQTDSKKGKTELFQALPSQGLGEFITIEALAENGNTEVLFCGLIQNICLEEEGGLVSVFIRASAATCLMDDEIKSRSFQKASMTYKELVGEILKDYKKVMPMGGDCKEKRMYADVLWNVEDKPIGLPIIQYQETDWEFLKRIASHLHTQVTSEATAEMIRIYVGLNQGDLRGGLNGKEHGTGFQMTAFQAGKGQGAGDKYSYLYYDVENMECCRMGERLKHKGREYPICGIRGEMRGGMMFFSYRLADKAFFETEEYYNGKIKGISLIGTVLDTKEESVRIHLDMDSEQKTGDAYFYPWRPITGNLLYCMPEKGERVALHIQTQDEREGIAMYSVRGKQTGESDWQPEVTEDKRLLTTNRNKKMYVFSDEIGLNVVGANQLSQEIALQDSSGLSIKAAKKISLVAGEELILQGKTVDLQGDKELTFVRKDIASPTVVNLCNDFDGIGRKGVFTKTQTEKVATVSKRNGTQQTPYQLGEVTMHMISNIPVLGMGNPERADMELEEPDVLLDIMASVPIIRSL